MKRGFITGYGGIRLAYTDFGGNGPGLLLLHGLTGRASTWGWTASWLTPHYHVVGIDQRGHGLSDKPDNRYSHEEYVKDAEAAVEQLGLSPAVVIGHSMGALAGWGLAVQRSDLVRGLVIGDMRASTGAVVTIGELRNEFLSWPLPFPSIAAVREYFGRDGEDQADWHMEVMVEKEDGYYPQFNFEHMVQSIADLASGDERRWEELGKIECPTLVVRAGAGTFLKDEAIRMVRTLKRGRYAEVAGARHLMHLHQPQAWRTAVEPFLVELARAEHGHRVDQADSQ